MVSAISAYERPVQDLLHVRLLVVEDGQGVDVLFQRHLPDPAGRARIPRPRCVVRDLDQPVLRLERLLAALERPVGVQERRLRDVLGVGRIPEERKGVVVDVLDVASIEPFEGKISS